MSATILSSAVLEAALDLAQNGVPVFPVLENKKPATPRGFKDAVDNPAAAEVLWRRHPGPLIGVPTGTASGVDVLDIDPRHDGHLWWLARSHLIPETRLHRTRGAGLHALFLHADGVRNTESKLAPGVDTRGTGGYAVWWPATGCRVVDAPIAPWPDWLLRELLGKLEQERRPSRAFRPLDSADHAQRVAERVLRRVAHAGAGQRYYALRKAAYAMGGLLEMLPFGETEALGRLVSAAEQAGAEDRKHAERIAKWGLGHGKAQPFKLRESR